MEWAVPDEACSFETAEVSDADAAAAARVVAEAADRQLAAQRRGTMLHVFAGNWRAGNFEHAGSAIRVHVDGVDILRDAVEQNVMAPHVEEALVAAVEAGVYDVIWIGTP